MDVVTIKLNSGEEVIARFLEKSDKTVVVKRPICLSPGKEGFGMIPWMMSADDQVVEFNPNSIIAMSETISEIAKKYIEVTSGLSLV